MSVGAVDDTKAAELDKTEEEEREVHSHLLFVGSQDTSSLSKDAGNSWF